MQAEDVRTAIAVAKARWQAADTPIAVAVSAGDTDHFGLAMDDAARRAAMARAAVLEADAGLLASTGPPPPAADWRTDGHVTAIRDQGSCGACVAFAVCASLEARAAILTDDTSGSLDLAEAHLFSCGRPGGCATGWEPDGALQHASDLGIGAEADFPYTGADQPCRTITPLVRVLGWTAATTLEARKQSVATNGPVIAGMDVYKDLLYYREGIYSHVTGEALQPHAVCVVGYSDEDACWIVKNSWGPSWGEDGYLRIAYDQCGLDSAYPFWDPDLEVLGG